MNQKIEWYKEVLELEPGSKVFFPLAKLLVTDQQSVTAIEVLSKGLDRHPEFVEARLLLIELLHKAGDTHKRDKEAEALADVLGRYSGFWEAWGNIAIKASSKKTAGIAMLMLAASLHNESISFDNVIESGLRSVLEGKGVIPVTASQTINESLFQSTPATSTPPLPCLLPADAVPHVATPEFVLEEPIVIDDSALLQDIQKTVTPSLAHASADALDSGSLNQVSQVSQVSTRTRSMAEVLAEQGDLKGALDIYTELQKTAINTIEQAEIQQRVNELQAALSPAQPVASPVATTATTVDALNDAHSSAPAGVVKDKAVSVLQLLASRLEERAR